MGLISLYEPNHVSALSVFRRSCGLPDAIVLSSEDSDRPGSPPLDHRFDTPFLVIGRHSESDLILDDPSVSRRHALIQAVAGRLYCLDLQSRTQLRWQHDDQPRSRGWLLPGQVLGIGPFRLQWRAPTAVEPLAPADWDPSESAPAGSRFAENLPGVVLELPIQLGASKETWRIEGMLSMVGRLHTCQLVLADESVSRLHAYFLRTPTGLWVVDLRARQGVHVNGSRVRWAWLDDGDLVKIGPFGFRVRYDSTPSMIGRAEVPLSAGQLGESSDEEMSSRALVPRPKSGRSLAIRGRSRPPERSLPALRSRPPASELIGLLHDPDASWQPAVDPSSRQIEMWQQQMQAMESFHHDMILMVQMFAAMHREHLKSVRDELDQVRRLTHELEELRRSMTTATPGRAPATGGLPGTSENHAQAARREHGRLRPRGAPADARPAPPPRQSTARSADAGSLSPRDRTASVPHAGGSNELSLHSALCRRIDEIQKERQGYWRKILSTISK